jgi:hypothetical protein
MSDRITMYRSLTTGRLYTATSRRVCPDDTEPVRIAVPVVLQPEQLCGPNDIFELLRRAGQAEALPVNPITPSARVCCPQCGKITYGQQCLVCIREPRVDTSR